MSRLKRLIVQAHRRSLWQALAVYLGVSYAVVEAVDIFSDNFGLPDWLFPLAIVLLLLALPFVVVASLQREDVAAGEAELAGEETEARRRVLTWRNAGFGFLGALALWGVVATGWLALGGVRAAPAGPIDSIVVLPFENFSGDPEQEYFVAGMHDALTTELAQIGALRVISRTSAMLYKDSNKSAPQIARELNVDGIVEASVFRAGDSVRIQVQLIQALPEERHLWAHSYDRQLGDVLTIHSDVVRAVAREIEVELTPQQETRLASARRVSPETYDLYLKGMHQLYKYTPEGFATGLAYLNQAIDNDPTEPLPYAGLALGLATIGHSPRPPPDALPRAKELALTALRLDETLAEAHAALAEVKLYYDWDLDAARQSFERALELNPNLAQTRGHYAWYLTLVGSWDDALAEMRRAKDLDPLAPIYSGWLGWMYYWAGRYEEALAEARSSLDLNPEFPLGHHVMGLAYAEQGKFEEAIAAHERAEAISPDWKWGLGIDYAKAGREDEALRVAGELEADITQWNSWSLAEIYAALGDKEEAIRWVEEAFERRHAYMPWLNRFAPFEFLRDDPRFQDVARRANAPP
jgi:TolB-like protein